MLTYQRQAQNKEMECLCNYSHPVQEKASINDGAQVGPCKEGFIPPRWMETRGVEGYFSI